MEGPSRCLCLLAQLDSVKADAVLIHHDGYVNASGSRRLIRAMSKIDEQLTGEDAFATGKIKLG
jgi:hypothetical protein